MKHYSRPWWEKRVGIGTVALGLILAWLIWKYGGQMAETLTVKDLAVGLLTVVFAAMTVQAGLFLYWISYAWNNPEATEKNRSPKEWLAPAMAFTAILPARHEEKVIGDTIKAISDIDYPEEKKELLVVIRDDDEGTLKAARKAIYQIGKTNIRLVVATGKPVNKPNQLNWGLEKARGDVIVPFDAEDQPHRDIYKIVNTVMIRDKADVVQGGVQLMNYRSSWFATLNCLEYFFWFKSALHFFARMGVVPLGGNTVFFKRYWLNRAGGWDENCLTEDGEIGMKMSQMGAKIAVVYDEKYVTQEETPPTIESFVQQRTRWHQGYLQILAKGQWKHFPTLRQKVLAAYLLVLPEIVAVMFFLAPIMTGLTTIFRLPLVLAMFSFVPMYLLWMFVALLVVGSWEFARAYKLKYPWWMPIRVIGSVLPFQLVLAISAVRAMRRQAAGQRTWEKTTHVNAHRAYVGQTAT